MKFEVIKPCASLTPYIHSYWEFTGEKDDHQWERSIPDGCQGLLINLGEKYKMEEGFIDFGKTYVLGKKTTFRDAFIEAGTHLLGVYLKPGKFHHFFHYDPQFELVNKAIEFDKQRSFNLNKILKDPYSYLNRFFLDKLRNSERELQETIEDIHKAKGNVDISGIAKKQRISVRSLERRFKLYVGISPKEFANIVRFQYAYSAIIQSTQTHNLSDIAFEFGYYDHAHLANEIKKYTGHAPSQIVGSDVLHDQYPWYD